MIKKINIDFDKIILLFGIKTDNSMGEFLLLLNNAFNLDFSKISINDENFKNNLIFKAENNSGNYKLIMKSDSNKDFFLKYKELNAFFIANIKQEEQKEIIFSKLKKLDNVIFVSKLNIDDISKKNRQILFL